MTKYFRVIFLFFFLFFDFFTKIPPTFFKWEIKNLIKMGTVSDGLRSPLSLPSGGPGPIRQLQPIIVIYINYSISLIFLLFLLGYRHSDHSAI